MEVIAQSFDEILSSLQPLTVEWMDETARRVIQRMLSMPVKETYATEDVQALLDQDFNDGMLICRSFLGLSKDRFATALKDARGDDGTGVMAYRADRGAFIEDLVAIGLLEAMTAEVNRIPHWSDVLVERLRSGRGSAISGQRRGRNLEDFAEAIVTSVFGKAFHKRCSFTGRAGRTEKCDFAIPSKTAPHILIESKAYGATGSKMTDVTGDIEKIIAAKRPDTAFLFVTDGVTWRLRQNDLRKIVRYQNNGDITRIYTTSMAKQLEADLQQLKREYGI